MWKHIVLFTIWFALTLQATSKALANESKPTEELSTISTPSAQANSTQAYRNFYEVLDDVLADFEYDLQNGNVTGLKNISIRNIATSENVPPSFKSHLELLITERILKNSKTRVIQCLPCKARKTSLNGDQVVISSPDTNPSELARIAKLSNIENFLDATFSFQPTGMVLSMFIADPESGNITWSRSYNSETSRASAFKRGVDYSQIDEARKSTEYAPTIQSRLILYYMYEPSLSKSEGCLGLGYRMMERYDNRKKEVGFEANYLANSSTIIHSDPTVTTNLYSAFGFNLSLLFLHSWNMIGEEENYNKIRGSVYVGLGGTYSSGYLGGLIRTGYEWRLAKHFSFSLNLGYKPSASAFINNSDAGTVGGPEYGLGVHVLF